MRQVGAAWVRAGHNVRILCCNEGWRLPERENLDGIEVLRQGRRATAPGTIAIRSRSHMRWANVVIENLLEIPLLAPLYARKPLFTLCHHLMGKQWFSVVPLPQALVGYLAERILPFVYRGARFIVPSDATGGDLAKLGINPERVSVVPWGIDSQLYRPGGEKTPHPSLLFVGRTDDRRKGVDDLIAVMEAVQGRYPNAELTIVGPGKRQRELRKTAEGRRIRVLGFVDEATKIRLYQESWLHLIPSAKEGFGLTAIESSACGTPTVAYDAPGLVSVVEQLNGLRVPIGDWAAMADRVVSLIESPSLRETLAAGGLELSRRYSWEQVAKTLLDVINST